MSDGFEFVAPGQVAFGPGKVRRVPEFGAAWGQRVLVVTGSSSDRAAALIADLQQRGFICCIWRGAGEPEVSHAEAAARAARDHAAEWVLSVGGGAALDLGKAAAALAPCRGPVMDYLEVVGKGRPLDAAPLPMIAVPTTAGTGSEATKNAVLKVPDSAVKVSLRDPRMVPQAVFLDPDLTRHLPPDITAATGMDALTQLLEAAVCRRATPWTDGLCKAGIRAARHALPRCVAEGGDLEARAAMLQAAYFSGLALANAGLGAVHGFAAPLGGRYPIAHGIACASLLAPVWRINLETLRLTAPTGPELQRFTRAAEWLTDRPGATAEDAIEWIEALAASLKIPRLSQLGVPATDHDELCRAAQQASSMKANPAPLDHDALMRILDLAG
ncbi:MAG: iron-containing alcohol dehydrogenase [Verrucomicrobiales bacterium]|nr:iron-containing alcohol dehydrogenase [Verrucomicrobiales bacterium]